MTTTQTKRQELERALNHLAEEAAHTPRRVDLLVELSREISSDDPFRAERLAASAHAVARGIGYDAGAAAALRLQGLASYYRANYDVALDRSMAAHELAVEQHDQRAAAASLHTVGMVYRQLGDYGAALDHYHRALELLRELGDVDGEATELNSIGLLHHYLGDHDEAMECYRHSLELWRSRGDRSGEAHSLNNLGGIHQAVGLAAKARDHFERALSLARELGDLRLQAIALNNLGEARLQLGDLDGAERHLRESLELKERLGNLKGQVESLLLLGSVLTARHELEPARELLERALRSASELRILPEVYRAHEALSVVHKKAGRLEEALVHHERFREVERQVLNADAEQRTRHLRQGFEITRSRREAELYKARAVDLSDANRRLAEALTEAERARLDAESQRRVAESADSVKGELLSIAVHDLKNPLQSILGLSELIAGQTEDAIVDEWSRAIAQSTRRMLHSISELLEMAAMEAGRLELRPQNFSFSDLVTSCAEASAPAARAKDQSIQTDVVNDLVIVADEERVREVVENLLSNAIKYSPFGRAIYVSLGRHGSSARLCVRDEGPGLSADDQAKLFGKYQRLSARPTGGESSSGLGLAIVKQLVEMMGGQVRAESKGPGHGTSFLVEFPLDPMPRSLDQEA